MGEVNDQSASTIKDDLANLDKQIKLKELEIKEAELNLKHPTSWFSLRNPSAWAVFIAVATGLTSFLTDVVGKRIDAINQAQDVREQREWEIMRVFLDTKDKKEAFRRLRFASELSLISLSVARINELHDQDRIITLPSQKADGRLTIYSGDMELLDGVISHLSQSYDFLETYIGNAEPVTKKLVILDTMDTLNRRIAGLETLRNHIASGHVITNKRNASDVKLIEDSLESLKQSINPEDTLAAIKTKIHAILRAAREIENTLRSTSQ